MTSDPRAMTDEEYVRLAERWSGNAPRLGAFMRELIEDRRRLDDQRNALRALLQEACGMMKVLDRHAQHPAVDEFLARASVAGPRVPAPAPVPGPPSWVWLCPDCQAWTMNIGRGVNECGNCGTIKPPQAALIVCEFRPPTKAAL
jgi:hypothetical protein